MTAILVPVQHRSTTSATAAAFPFPGRGSSKRIVLGPSQKRRQSPEEPLARLNAITMFSERRNERIFTFALVI